MYNLSRLPASYRFVLRRFMGSITPRDTETAVFSSKNTSFAVYQMIKSVKSQKDECSTVDLSRAATFLDSLSVVDNTTICRLIRLLSLIRDQSEIFKNCIPLICEAKTELRVNSYSVLDISEIIHSAWIILAPESFEVDEALRANVLLLVNRLVTELLAREFCIQLESEFNFKRSTRLQIMPLSALSNICFAISSSVKADLLTGMQDVSHLASVLIVRNVKPEAISGTRAFHLVSLMNSICKLTIPIEQEKNEYRMRMEYTALRVLVSEVEKKSNTLTMELLEILKTVLSKLESRYAKHPKQLAFFTSTLSSILDNSDMK